MGGSQSRACRRAVVRYDGTADERASINGASGEYENLNNGKKENMMLRKKEKKDHPQREG